MERFCQEISLLKPQLTWIFNYGVNSYENYLFILTFFDGAKTTPSTGIFQVNYESFLLQRTQEFYILLMVHKAVLKCRQFWLEQMIGFCSDSLLRTRLQYSLSQRTVPSQMVLFHLSQHDSSKSSI